MDKKSGLSYAFAAFLHFIKALIRYFHFVNINFAVLRLSGGRYFEPN